MKIAEEIVYKARKFLTPPREMETESDRLYQRDILFDETVIEVNKILTKHFKDQRKLARECSEIIKYKNYGARINVENQHCVEYTVTNIDQLEAKLKELEDGK